MSVLFIFQSRPVTADIIKRALLVVNNQYYLTQRIYRSHLHRPICQQVLQVLTIFVLRDTESGVR